jgi:hypothetical protein
MSVDERQAMRAAVLLVGTTSALVGITMLLLTLATRSEFFEAVEGCWLIATMLATPFWVVPMHLRMQSPRDSSAALAFVTGIPTWLFSAAHAFYFHVMTFGT